MSPLQIFILGKLLFDGQLTSDYSCFLQEVLYCAKKAGVTHILKAGGAQVE
jgi:hypothetical protein